MNKKNIVIISTFFPPNIHIASNRIYAYAKYLAKEHNITVVTSANEFSKKVIVSPYNTPITVYNIPNKGIFSNLLFYSGKENPINHKIKTIFRLIFKKLNISFYYKWRINTSCFLKKYLEKNDVDIILSSYAPDDTLLVTYDILKNNNNIKWYIDMRDEYSDEENISKKQKLIRKENEFIFSKRADLIITVSAPLLNLLKKRMPYAGKYLEIRNGYDHQVPVNYNSNSKELKLGYYGSFQGKTKPDILFQAILELKKELHVFPIKIYIATKSINFNIPDELKNSIILLPYTHYEESIKSMGTMDCNILILPSDTRVGVYSGKLFDYISVQKSILGLINKNDVAATLINDLQCGYVADPNNKEDVKMALLSLYKDWKQQNLKVASIKNIQKLHRKHQIHKLLGVINNI